ncbi:MAG: hypothetical protein ACU88J_12435 [Gammaproteobacteria bacterium]
MMGEYATLIGANGFFNSLAGYPTAIINFLHTKDGQLSAAVLAVVVLLLYIRKS